MQEQGGPNLPEAQTQARTAHTAARHTARALRWWTGATLGQRGPESLSSSAGALPSGPCLPRLNKKEKTISRPALFWGMPRPQAPLFWELEQTVGWGWVGPGALGKSTEGWQHAGPLPTTGGHCRPPGHGPLDPPAALLGPPGPASRVQGWVVLAAAQHRGPAPCACSVPRTPEPSWAPPACLSLLQTQAYPCSCLLAVPCCPPAWQRR